MRQEADRFKIKFEESEKEKSHFKGMCEYLQLKGVNTTRRDRTMNSFEVLPEDQYLKMNEGLR